MGSLWKVGALATNKGHPPLTRETALVTASPESRQGSLRIHWVNNFLVVYSELHNFQGFFFKLEVKSLYR